MTLYKNRLALILLYGIIGRFTDYMFLVSVDLSTSKL